MSKKIRVLPSRTINQIAAGEVIENPASVVKELVENSIDAGARRIVVETFGGGFQSIQVSDDGLGMAPEDASLSIERHATSKLSDADELFALTTMGFRGEALASIASIAKMELLTAAEGCSPIRLEVEGGAVLRVEPAARARGTTVSIRSLFFNVPARKKFQKSATASSAEITRTMTQLALAHPDVGFELIAQERTLFSVPSSEGRPLQEVLEGRTKALLGEEFFSNSTLIAISEKEFELIGFVAKPEYSRPNRSGQSLFINRRPISCPSISYAVRDAYGTRLSTDRHPVFLLHFTLDPALVDVNVHPQKKEVRIREESRLKYRLHTGVNEALSQKEHSEGLPFFADPPAQWPFASAPGIAEETEDLPIRTQHAPQSPLPLEFGISPIGVHGHYLLLDAGSIFPQADKKGIAFVDLSSAETAICYEELLERQTQPLSQRLLFPLTLLFSKEEGEWLLTGIDEMANLGLQIHQVGEGAFLVDAIPPFLKEEEIQELLYEWIGEIKQLESRRLLSFARSLAQRIRRHERHYQKEEAVGIVKKLLQLKNYKYCPRGRSTIHLLEENEISAFFAAR